MRVDVVNFGHGVLCHLVSKARSGEAFRADDQSQYASANGAV